MPHNITHPLYLSPLLLMLASCSSTEVVPVDIEDNSHQISISVSAPDSYGFEALSRAGESHQIRLIAHLYSLNEDGSAATSPIPLSSQEVLHRDSETKLTFNIENTGEYCVTVFADYIPADATPTDNHYPDNYYDTSSPEKIRVKLNDATIADFFNNDLRDCFVGKTVFTKGLNSCEKELRLTRPVSRISISAPGDPVEDLIQSVQVAECSHLDSYEFAIDDSTIVGTPASTATNPLAGAGAVTLVPMVKRLFYYYTFGSEAGATDQPALGAISFTLSPINNIELENMDPRTVASGLVKPIANYQMSINGGAGWITAKPGGDDITVHIQPIPAWNDTPGTIL